MQRVEPLRLPARSAAAQRPASGARRVSAGRAALFAAVGLYVAGVLLAPLVGLLVATHDAGWGQVARAVTEPAALEALRLSLALVAIAVVVNAAVGVAGAIALVRHRFLGRALLDASFELPLAVSPVMIGLAFLLLLGRGGVFAPWLDALGVKVVFAFPGLVVATLFVTMPFTLREVAHVLKEVGPAEQEAAATLGATDWQTFRRVTLPQIRGALGAGLLMTAARALGDFGAVLVLGGSIAGHTQTATTLVHDALEERRLPVAYGMATLLALVSVSLLVVLELSKARTQRGRKA